MVPVSEIWEDVKKLVGVCAESTVYRRLNRAIEILANKSDWDPLTGYLDIVCESQLVTLPREIETPLTISYDKYPAMGRDQLFQWHLNGPGSSAQQCGWRWWEDGPDVVTFRSLASAAKLAAVPQNSEDAGKTLTIYGFGTDNQEIRTNGAIGYTITLGSYEAPGEGGGSESSDVGTTPTFSRITRVRKAETEGPVELWSLDANGALDTLLAVYAWDDINPRFRRLRIDRSSADVVRVHYRRRNFKVRSQEDLIPLHSAEAVVMMVRSLKYYDELEIDRAVAFEATAVRWLTEEQRSIRPAIMTPIQVANLPVRDDDIN